MNHRKLWNSIVKRKKKLKNLDLSETSCRDSRKNICKSTTIKTFFFHFLLKMEITIKKQFN